MVLMSTPQTSATLTYKPHHRDRITLYVALSLASKMPVKMLLYTVPCTVARPLGVIFETTYENA
jgi:hypothetical protein